MATHTMSDGNTNGDTPIIPIQKIPMNTLKLKNQKIHHKQLLCFGPLIKTLSTEYSHILNYGMKEAQEFKTLSNFTSYQVFLFDKKGASLFFYQFYELSAGFKILTFFPLAMFYTRLRDKCVDPDIKEMWLRDMIHQNE